MSEVLVEVKVHHEEDPENDGFEVTTDARARRQWGIYDQLASQCHPDDILEVSWTVDMTQVSIKRIFV